MAELKTKATAASVDAFLDTIDDEDRRTDCKRLLRLMKKAVKAPATMWGPSIVGFGDMRYRTADGAENAWFCAGFSPRKKDLTLYLMGGVMGRPELKRLGQVLDREGLHLHQAPLRHRSRCPRNTRHQDRQGAEGALGAGSCTVSLPPTL